MKKLINKLYVTIVFLTLLLQHNTNQLHAAEQKPQENSFSTLTSKAPRMALAYFNAFRKKMGLKDVSVSREVSVMKKEPTNTIPTIIFNLAEKTIKLAYMNKETNTITRITDTSFRNVVTYNFSPKKRYILAQQVITEQSIVSRFTPKWSHGTVEKAKLIDTDSFAELASFDGKIIMHQFSPDETTLLLSRSQKNIGEKLGFIKPSTKGALQGKREQSSTGEILRYELLDIASKTVIASFENIQAIDYDSDNTLIIKYDNGELEKAIINRDVRLSPIQRIMSFITTPPKAEVILTELEKDIFNMGLFYDNELQKLTVQFPNKKTKKIENVVSYDVSPNKKYIFVRQYKKAGFGRSMATGDNPIRTIIVSTDFSAHSRDIVIGYNKSDETFGVVIFYEFMLNADETRLLTLKISMNSSFLTTIAKTSAPIAAGGLIELFLGTFAGRAASALTSTIMSMEQSTANAILEYELINTTTGKTIHTFDSSTKTAYFKSAQELIIIDENDKYESWDPIEGITFAQKNAKAQSKERWEQGVTFASRLPGQVVTAASNAAGAAKEKISEVATATQQAVSSNVEAARQKAAGAMSAVAQKTSSLIEGAKGKTAAVKEYWFPSAPAEEPISPPVTTPEPITTSKETPQIKQKEEAKEAEKPQTIEGLMDLFASDNSPGTIQEIITMLKEGQETVQEKQNMLVDKYNTYTEKTTKEKFAQLFFAPPAGDLQIKLTNVGTTENGFTASVNNDHLYIMQDKKIIFTSEELDADTKAIALSNDNEYLAISYDGINRIDVFKKQGNTFAPFNKFKQKGFASTIIGLKFITIQGEKYLFFLDQEYKMGMQKI